MLAFLLALVLHSAAVGPGYGPGSGQPTGPVAPVPHSGPGPHGPSSGAPTPHPVRFVGNPPSVYVGPVVPAPSGSLNGSPITIVHLP